jgi:alpha-ketoglutarate-dependent taurine dioxygenase
MRPILHHQPATDSTPERVVIHCIRREFTGALATPRSKNIPPLTEAQAEALDAIHFLAEKYQLRLDFQKGDIQYVNNFSILHSRESFKDTPDQQ